MSAAEILAALSAGHFAQQVAHAAKELLRLGTMSGGGSAGAILADGSFIGKCPRQTMLRMRGIQEGHEEASLSMFSAGLANEQIVAGLLKDGGLEVEHDVELRHTLADGREVIYHLDLVLRDKGTGRIAVVVETKMVASLWTAKSVCFENEPKSDHLVQLGSYLSHPDCSDAVGVLLYSNRVDFHISTAPAWLQKKFTPGTPHVEFKDDGSPLKIRPFDKAYDVKFLNNTLVYATDGLENAVRTKLTKDSIRKYYETVSAAERGGELLPRPSGKHANGNKSYMPCDYCPLKPTCDRYESAAFDVWLDHATATLAQEN